MKTPISIKKIYKTYTSPLFILIGMRKETILKMSQNLANILITCSKDLSPTS